MKHFTAGLDIGARGAPPVHVAYQPLPGRGDQPLPATLMGPPQFLVRNAPDLFPVVVPGCVLQPLPSGIALEQLAHVPREPGLDVYAVGHVTDRRFVFRHAGPDTGENAARDTGVQLADCVRHSGEPKGEDRHIEVSRRVPWVLAAEPDEFVAAEPDFLPVFVEVFLHQLRREHIKPRRYRRMRGEDVPRGGGLPGGLKREVSAFHQAADALEAQEGGVAFIHVADFGPDAERVQSLQASHAQEYLLPDPLL